MQTAAPRRCFLFALSPARLTVRRCYTMRVWAEKFYASPAWGATRSSYLQSVNYLCEVCSTDDDPKVAKIVHHKRSLTKANINNLDISLSWDNLQAVCQDCHNRIHHSRARAPRYRFDSEGGLIEIPPPVQTAGSRPRTPSAAINFTPRRRV